MKKDLINKGLILSELIAVLVMGGDIAKQSINAAQLVDVANVVGNKEIEISSNEGEIGTPTMLATKKIEDKELVNKAIDKLKYYFDISIDTSEFDCDVVFFEGYEDIKPNYGVYFTAPGNREILYKESNIGSDGYPTAEAEKLLKPEYHLSFLETKEITDIYTSYVNWGNLEIALNIEQSKKLAKDFLVSKKLAEYNNIEFMGLANISEDRVVITYQIGSDRAIQVHINTYTGKVNSFGSMSKEHAEMILTPKEEGFGIG